MEYLTPNGQDGVKVITGTETINTYATVAGAANQNIVTTSLSVSIGDLVALHQTQGATPAHGEFVRVLSVGSGQFTADRKLKNTYTTGAQAIFVPEYQSLAINGTMDIPAWDGSRYGIGIIACSGKVSGTGTISGKGKGFRGGTAGVPAANTGRTGQQGESQTGVGVEANSSNGGGGGGGSRTNSGPSNGGAGGGGGGNSVAGDAGTQGTFPGSVGVAGGIVSDTQLNDISLGSGGGAGGGYDGLQGGSAGRGGAYLYIVAGEVDFSSMTSIDLRGDQGGAPAQTQLGAGGGGSGGNLKIRARKVNLGTNKVLLDGGAARTTGGDGGTGGKGANGRFRGEVCSLTGSIAVGSVSNVVGTHSWCGGLASIM